jgi:hypothetical protein
MAADVSISPGEVPLARGEPERIYHYTDAGGLFGIIRGKNLWASDVWFMNDAREALYGFDVIEQALDSLTLEHSPRDVMRTKAREMLQSVRDQEKGVPSYIACLTKEDDDLSQWRAYGRDRGFAIGFDVAALRSMCSIHSEAGEPTYREVRYNKAEQRNIISALFEPAFKTLSDSDLDDALKGSAWFFIQYALQILPSFKDPAFASEREIRLHVFQPPPTVATKALHFRTGAMGVVPYIEIDLREPGTDQMSVIREVVLGPQANERESQRAVQQLLVHHGMPDVEVRLSKIPLRPQ